MWTLPLREPFCTGSFSPNSGELVSPLAAAMTGHECWELENFWGKFKIETTAAENR